MELVVLLNNHIQDIISIMWICKEGKLKRGKKYANQYAC